MPIEISPWIIFAIESILVMQSMIWILKVANWRFVDWTRIEFVRKDFPWDRLISHFVFLFFLYMIYSCVDFLFLLKAVVTYPAEPFSSENKQLQWLNQSRLIYFIDRNSTSIPETPRCGFNNIKCPKKSTRFSFFFHRSHVSII